MKWKNGRKWKSGGGRNGEIDLFRFVFAMIILLGHTCHTFKLGIMPRSGICTEYFFLVSGCLMGKKASTQSRQLTNEQIANLTYRYIWRKVGSFYPYYLMAFILMIFFSLFVREWTFVKMIKELLQSIPLLTLSFVGVGIRGKLCLWGSWFLSAMIIASFVLYPILLKNYHISTKVIFPLIGMFLVYYLYKHYSIITVIMDNKTFVIGGLLRAISEIAIGASIYELSLRIKSVASGKKMFLLTPVKYFAYLVAILYAVRFHNSMTDIDYLLWLIIGVTLSFSGAGFVIKESVFTCRLGKLSLPIYIFHMLLVSTAYQILGENINIWVIIFVVVISILFSVGLMYITDFIMKRIKRKIKVA